MKLELSTYLAGIATAGVAIAAGFGGGVYLANSVDSRSAVPAPGMSRIERTKRDEPKPAAVAETTGAAQSVEEPAVNPLAEAQPLRVDPQPSPVNANAVEPAGPAVANAAAVPAPQPERPVQRPIQEAVLPAATQTISSAPRHRRDTRRAQAEEQRSAPHDPRIREPRKTKRAVARADEPNTGQREVARYREGGIRYVVRTENGRPANPGEVEQLKRQLRDRREGRVAETYALSYGPERRGVFPQIFRD